MELSKKALFFAVLVLVVVVLVELVLFFNNLSSKQVLVSLNSSSQPSSSNLSGNSTLAQINAAHAEVARLASLAAQNNITESDLEPLDKILPQDAAYRDHFDEIKTMVQYKEYTHAGHDLSFLDAALNGQDLICPGHEISHYYVLMRHGANDLANDSLNDGINKIVSWTPQAREYRSNYPGTEPFNTTLYNLNKYISQIENGNSTASDAEIDYLANIICTQNNTS